MGAPGPGPGRLATGLVQFVEGSVRSRTASAAENLFLRKPLALYRERVVRKNAVRTPWMADSVFTRSRCFFNDCARPSEHLCVQAITPIPPGCRSHLPDAILACFEQRLRASPTDVVAWAPSPLEWYPAPLPESIRMSSGA